MIKGQWMVALAVIATAAGCSSYRVVNKTQTGGTIALTGNRDEAREKANGYMASQCAGGYDVVEEGEAVVGSQSSANTTQQNSIIGGPSLNTQSTSRDMTEWRIKYQCKGAGGAAGAAPAGSGAPAAAPAPKAEIHELIVRF